MTDEAVLRALEMTERLIADIKQTQRLLIDKIEGIRVSLESLREEMRQTWDRARIRPAGAGEVRLSDAWPGRPQRRSPARRASTRNSRVSSWDGRRRAADRGTLNP